MNNDEMLSSAAKDFLNRYDYQVGDLVRLKKNIHLVNIGYSETPYTENFAFIQWVNSIVGTSDDPLSAMNFVIGDCLVMALNGNGGCSPILLDSRFIEPAV